MKPLAIKLLKLYFVIDLLTVLHSCTSNNEDSLLDNEPPVAGSSFAVLQEEILTPNCATSGCHDSQTKSNGLDLSPSVAYQNLINIQPTNENARQDKLLRVKPGNPYQSFFYVKLDSSNFHVSDGYGMLMPMGSRPLTVGQVEFIREWIAAGALKNEFVTDPLLLKDTRSQNEALYLAPPVQGKQFSIKPFTVPPKFERELFIAQKNTDDLYMTKFEMLQRDRSHHFILYGYDPAKPPRVGLPKEGVIRDLYNANNDYNLARFSEMDNRIFIIGSQLKSETISFPEGMALKIPAGWLLDFNSHYTNGTRDTTRGEVYFNIHTTTPDKVKTLIKPLQLGNININLPPNKETTIETTWMVGGTASPGGDRFSSKDTLVKIYGLTSHFHKYGKKFIIQIVGGVRNGEVVYTCTNWLNPPLVQYNNPIILRKGEGLKSIVTWYNDSNQTVVFGLRSIDEMNFIFGFYSSTP